MMFAQALLLLFVANGAPIVARLLLAGRLAWPVDHAYLFFDGRPLLGHSKTWRGIFFSLLLTSLVALLLALPWQVGLLFAFYAMCGDLLSSFIKRRSGIEPSGRALGLDQVPEALLPLLLLQSPLALTWHDIILLVILFIVLGQLFSRLLYRLHIRNRPY
ncbi:MAG TPA: CDP-archaeol synthase [Chromatiales bacterium]|nr:CDP-archaeol synthase [Chromatiales bacterium]